MKLGTSLRFLYPTGPHTYERFKEVLATLPPGGFIERPMGAFETDVQAAQVLEVAAAAHAAGLDGLLFGDSHAVPASYANAFAPVPTVARLLAVTGTMPVGMVLLAPFTSPSCLPSSSGHWPPSPRPPPCHARQWRAEPDVRRLRYPPAQPRPPAGRADARAARTPGR